MAAVESGFHLAIISLSSSLSLSLSLSLSCSLTLSFFFSFPFLLSSSSLISRILSHTLSFTTSSRTFFSHSISQRSIKVLPASNRSPLPVSHCHSNVQFATANFTPARFLCPINFFSPSSLSLSLSFSLSLSLSRALAPSVFVALSLSLSSSLSQVFFPFLALSHHIFLVRSLAALLPSHGSVLNVRWKVQSRNAARYNYYCHCVLFNVPIAWGWCSASIFNYCHLRFRFVFVCISSSRTRMRFLAKYQKKGYYIEYRFQAVSWSRTCSVRYGPLKQAVFVLMNSSMNHWFFEILLSFDYFSSLSFARDSHREMFRRIRGISANSFLRWTFSYVRYFPTDKAESGGYAGTTSAFSWRRWSVWALYILVGTVQRSSAHLKRALYSCILLRSPVTRCQKGTLADWEIISFVINRYLNNEFEIVLIPSCKSFSTQFTSYSVLKVIELLSLGPWFFTWRTSIGDQTSAFDLLDAWLVAC